MDKDPTEQPSRSPGQTMAKSIANHPDRTISESKSTDLIDLAIEIARTTPNEATCLVSSIKKRRLFLLYSLAGLKPGIETRQTPHFSGPGQTPHRYSEMSPFSARIALHVILLFHWPLISKQYSDGHHTAGYLCVTAGDSSLLPVKESPSIF